MEDAIAHGAIRRLSIDLANVAGQLAIAQASIELLQGTAQSVVPDSWDKVVEDDEMRVTLRGDQVDSVMRLLTAVQAIS